MANKNKVVLDTPADEKDSLYQGTVRVVTEADILADPRLVAASAVVGQLYDFSNLPKIKDGVIEHNVAETNKAKDLAHENRVRKSDRLANAPEFTSEAERLSMGVASDEEVANQKDIDEAARVRVEEKKNGVVAPIK